jgi:FkbM family methyltransferase
MDSWKWAIINRSRKFLVFLWMRMNGIFCSHIGLSNILFDKNEVWIWDGLNSFFRFDSSEEDGGVIRMHLGRKHELTELHEIMKCLHEDDVFFDIGANVGLISIPIVKRFPGMTVFAFEPVRKTRDLLYQNITKNRVAARFQVFPLAISDANGTCRISSTLGSSNFILGDDSKEVSSEVVEQVTFDSFVEANEIARCNFIKCDVEGAELLFLRGARNSIQRFRPFLFLEIQEVSTRKFHYSPTEIFQFLQRFGYSYVRINQEGVCLPSSEDWGKDLEEGHNFLFLPEKLPSIPFLLP